MKVFEIQAALVDGLHGRPAAAIVQLARGLKSSITLTHGGRSAQATHLLGLMTLGVKEGDTVAVSIDGPDEAVAAAALRQILQGA